MIATTGTKFWFGLLLFQFAFGLGVFAITRSIYSADPAAEKVGLSITPQALPQWSDRLLDLDSNLLDTRDAPATTTQDPAELSMQANAYFANQQYPLAAAAYERLLDFDPTNVDVHNNLGLTLHYLGRSAEATEWLDKGVALDPTNQRIWLTLGFVNADLGNTERAREALSNAAEMDAESGVGKSAARMLAELP